MNNINKQALNSLLNQHKGKAYKQKGAAILGMVLVIIIVVSLIVLAGSKSTILETKMVFNTQDKQRSRLAAESATQVAWQEIKDSFDLKAYLENSDDGKYVLTDTYAIEDSAKTSSNWQANKKTTTWPWGDQSKVSVVNEQLGGSGNPMKLITKRQYTVGLHKDSIRKGTANSRCIPVSMIGASQGGTANSRTLIEVKAIPKSTCYVEKVK